MTQITSQITIEAQTKQALQQIQQLNNAVSTFNRSVNQQNTEAMQSAKALEKQMLGVNFGKNFETQFVRMSGAVEQFSTRLDKGQTRFSDFLGREARNNDMLGKVAERRVKLMQSMQVALTGQMRGGQRGALITPKEFDALATGSKQLQLFGKQMDLGLQRSILFNEALAQGATQLTNWGKNMQWAGRQVMVGLTLPLTIFAATAVKSFSAVEEQLIQLRRVYGDLETTDYEKTLGVQQIEDAAHAWTRYGVSVADALKVGADVAATGAQGAEAIQQMNEAIRMATLGNFDMAESQQAIIAMMSAMGVASSDLRKEIDFLNAVENQTLLTMQDVADAVPRVGPVLKDMGGDVRDLTALLAAMKEGGVNAAEGANAIKAGLASLINPTKEATDMFAQFGIDIRALVNDNKQNPVALIQSLSSALSGLGDLSQQRLVETLFGKYQFARWSALFDNINKSGSQAAETLRIAGMSAEELARISSQELAQIEASPLTKFTAALEDLKATLVPIGESVLKVVTPFIEVFTKFADVLNNFPTPVVLIGGLIALVGPVRMLIGLFANFTGSIVSMVAGLRKLGQPKFLTETQIQAQLAAAALDEFNMEALEGVNVLDQQSKFVRELALDYQHLAGAVNVAALEVQSSQTTMTQSRAGVTVAGTAARRYGRRMATGGTVPGTGSGDKIPALLEPGEFVVSKRAAAKYGPTLAAMNDDTLQHMERGGSAARRAKRVRLAAGKPMTKSIQEMIEEMVKEGWERVAASEAMQSVGLIESRGGKSLTEVQTAAVRETYRKLGQTSAKAFLQGYMEIKANATSPNLTHLITGGSYIPGEQLQQMPEFKAGAQERAARALMEQYGPAGIGIQTFSPVKLPFDDVANRAMRPGFGGVNINQYEHIAAQRSQERQAHLEQKLLGRTVEPGLMGKLDKAVSAKMRASGVEQVYDPDVEAALRSIAAASTDASQDVVQLAKELVELSHHITEVSLVVDQVKLDQIADELKLLPGGPAHVMPGTKVKVRRLKSGEARLTTGGANSSAAGRSAIEADTLAVVNSAEALANRSMIETTEDALETHSESKVGKRIGNDYAAGLASGIREGTPEVYAAADAAADAALEPVQQLAQPRRSRSPAAQRRAGKQRVEQAELAAEIQGRKAKPRVRVMEKSVSTEMAKNAKAVEAATKAQQHQAEVATDTAKQVAEIGDAATNVVDHVEEEVQVRQRGISTFTKMTMGLDAISGVAMMAGGALGDFSQKVFMASMALSSLSMLGDSLPIGNVGGKMVGAFSGEFSAARTAARGRTVAKGGRIAKVASKGKTLAGGVARGVGAAAMVGGPAGLVVAGVVAASAALAFTFWQLNKSANKFDEALSISSDAFQKASEAWGFELRQLQMTPAVRGGSDATLEQIAATKAFIDENLSLQRDYLKSIEDETVQQAALTNTLTQFIARGAPREFALEVGRQLAATAGMSFDATDKFIKSLYDDSGEMIAGAGKRIIDATMQPIKDAMRIRSQEQSGGYITTAGGQERVSDALAREELKRNNPWQDISPSKKSTSGSSTTSSNGYKDNTQYLESVARAAVNILEQNTLLFQAGAVSIKDYDSSVRTLNTLVNQTGKGQDKIVDKLIELNPALEVWKDELKDSKSVVKAFALQLSGISMDNLMLKAQELDMDPDKLTNMVYGAMYTFEQAIQPRLNQLTSERGVAQQEYDAANKAVEDQEALIESINREMADMADRQEAILQPLQDQVYYYERLLDNLGEQRDLLQDDIELQQEKLDLIDEEIDKIEEARDAQLDNVNKIADARSKALQALQRQQQRASGEQSAFVSIGQALQSGDLAGALNAQREYTQEFGVDSLQNQLDAVDQWREASLDAINAEADAKIDAEQLKADAINKTIDALNDQIKALDKQIKFNERLKDSVQDTITEKQREFELDKRAMDQRLAVAQQDLVNYANRKKAAEENLGLIDKQITQLKSMPAQAAQSVLDSGKALGLSPDEVKEILSGEDVTEYLKTGTATKIKFVNTQGQEKTIEFQHSGGMIDRDSWSGTGKLKSDETPRILQAGEYVLRKEAVRNIGKHTLDKMNTGRQAPQDEANPYYHTGGFVRSLTAKLQGRMNKKVLKNLTEYGAMRIQAANEMRSPLAEYGNMLVGAMGEPIATNGRAPWNLGYQNGRIPLNALATIHGGSRMWPDAARAFNMMSDRYRQVAGNALTGGGYRTYEEQARLYYNYINGIGNQALAAPPGRSNHGWGLAVDVRNASTYGSAIFKWLRDNAGSFGFVNDVRGEPWHWKYNRMHDGGIVGSNEVPAILEKGELVIPKDGYSMESTVPTMSSYDTSSMPSMPHYAPASTASSFMPTVSSSSGGGGGGSSSYANNASNAYAVTVNVHSTNASAHEIANQVQARINRQGRKSR